MPRRKFQYDPARKQVVEVTPDEVKPLCDELHEDAASRSDDLYDGRITKRNAGKWPYASEAMAVGYGHDIAKGVKEAQAILAQHGVKTEYDSLGRPVLRDRAHRKAHMRALGFYDRNAGYGDAEPLHFTMDYHPENEAAKVRDMEQRLASGRLY